MYCHCVNVNSVINNNNYHYHTVVKTLRNLSSKY